MLEKLSFLIVSPDLESRTKLREVLNAFIYKGTVKYERSLHNLALRFVPGPATEIFDALFIASSFGRESIVNFIHQGRDTQGAKVPPIIIFINNQELDKSSEIATLYLEGIDGFISEPYTSEQLLGLITALKSNQGKPAADSAAKNKKAAEFLLFDAMSHIDELAKQKMNGEEPGGYALKNLRTVSKSLSKLVEQDMNAYGDILATTFQKAKPLVVSEHQRSAKKPQKRVVHPGSVIRDMMKGRGLTAERLKPILHMDAAQFDLLIAEQRSIDDTIAKELSRTLGMTPSEWMRLQREYDAKTQPKGGDKNK